MVAALKEKFGELNLTYSIGGQISFDVFPKVSPASRLPSLNLVGRTMWTIGTISKT